MKPLELEFEGIRSFSDRVEINFEPLTKSGLFGIFGSTGSGKSTILDAMIIALYGSINGMNMAEIVSARKQRAYVRFDFALSERGERKKYRVERTFTVKNGAYKNSTAFLYDTTGGSLISLAEKTNEVNNQIESIIGLGQSEFVHNGKINDISKNLIYFYNQMISNFFQCFHIDISIQAIKHIALRP